jgi:hypothetical protein
MVSVIDSSYFKVSTHIAGWQLVDGKITLLILAPFPFHGLQW